MALTKLTKPRARWATFQLSVVGAVVRSVFDKLFFGGGISPADFGAVGDGIADDTQALRNMFTYAPSGSDINLEGKRYLIYKGFEGVTTGDAVPIEDVIGLFGKSNITIRNGEIFCDDPKTAGVKSRYPNTLTLSECSNITLRNVKLVCKGESYGDADASVSMTPDERLVFCAQNSGCAIFIARCSNVSAYDSEFLEAGSVGSVYVSSSELTKFTNCHSSPDSLGYANYAFDSWVGNTTITGFKRHDAYLNNCTAFASEGRTYGSKGCVITEDRDVLVKVEGGYYADAYANGSANQIGNAFGANVSTVEVNGARVHNCASVGITGHSANGLAQLIVNNVHATDIRTAAHIQMYNSFGDSEAYYNNCNIDIISTALWPSGATELQKSSIIANMKVTSPITVIMKNCVVTGNAYRVTASEFASYGSFKAINCDLTVTHKISDSSVWGSADAGVSAGLEILDSKVNVTDLAAVDDIDTYKNKDANNVFTYLYFDYSGTTITSANMRQAFGSVNSGSASLQVLSKGAKSLVGCYDALSLTEGIQYLKYLANEGTAGSWTKRRFAMVTGAAATSGILILKNKTAHTYSFGHAESTFDTEVVGDEYQVVLYTSGDFTGVDVGDKVLIQSLTSPYGRY